MKNIIREARKKAGLTQGQLADAIHVSRPTVAKYEGGLIEPPVSKLKEMGNVLGVQWYELYSDSPNEQGRLIIDYMKDKISKGGEMDAVSDVEKAKFGFIQFKSADDEIAYLYGLLNDAGKFEAARCFSRHLDPQAIPEVIQYLQRLAETGQYKKTPPGDGEEGEG